MLIIDFKTGRHAYDSFKNMVLDAGIDIPSGLLRIKCTYCKQPQGGVIFDKSTYTGNKANELMGNIHLCSNCKPLLEKMYEDAKHDLRNMVLLRTNAHLTF